MWKSVIAVFIGAGCGALLRWWLGIQLNRYFSALPPGTLAANLLGAYIIGVAIAFFASFSAIAPEWRLFVVTGFCGGLTTFSSFAAELVSLLRQGRVKWVFGEALIHVTGSVLMVFAGIGTIVWMRGSIDW
jgi:fluoride exporter